MKLIKNNLTKIGVLALAVSALGGSVFAASQVQEIAKNKEDVTSVVESYTLTEEEAAELMKAGIMGMTVVGEVVDEADAFIIDIEAGKLVEGMNASLVGSGVFGKTGIDGEEATAQYMEITEDGTVITRALTAEEKKEFGINK